MTPEQKMQILELIDSKKQMASVHEQLMRDLKEIFKRENYNNTTVNKDVFDTLNSYHNQSMSTMGLIKWLIENN